MKQKVFWLPFVSVAVVGTIVFSGCANSHGQSSNGSKLETFRVLASEATADQLGQESMNAQALGDVAMGNERSRESADEYVRLGEMLMLPESFESADQMLTKALAQDPENAKANLYKAFTEPMLAAKGYLGRLQGLASSDKDREAVERLRRNVESLKIPGLQKFVEELDPGERPFESYYDLQRFARERLLNAINLSLHYLKHVNARKPIEVKLMPWNSLDVQNRAPLSISEGACSKTASGFVCSSASEKEVQTYHVDRHDVELLKTALRAMADQIRLSTAYSLKDAEVAFGRLRSLGEARREQGLSGLTQQEVVETIRSANALFTLEADNQLHKIAKSETQALRDGLELANLKSSLCDGSERTAANSLIRPICLEANMIVSMNLGLDLLSGPKEISLGSDEGGDQVRVVMDINAVLKNPPKDLKDLLPRFFDSKGNPIHYPDPTLGGLFPDGDLLTKLKLVNQ